MISWGVFPSPSSWLKLYKSEAVQISVCRISPGSILFAKTKTIFIEGNTTCMERSGSVGRLLGLGL